MLDNEIRLITQRGVVAALTGGRESGNLQAYIDRIPNKPEDFHAGAVAFRLKSGKQVAHGITAETFARIITLYIKASDEGSLHESQEDIADRCRRFSYALIGTAITVLVDEATGHRSKSKPKLNSLEEKCRLFLLDAPEEDRDKQFPPEYWKALSSVYRCKYVPGKNPPFFKMVIRKAVHDVVDVEVARRIKVLNPNSGGGKYHYKWYTGPALEIFREIVRRNITIMKQSSSKDDFWMRHSHEFRGTGLQLSF